jgi:predicted RNA polymerase sigma factor
MRHDAWASWVAELDGRGVRTQGNRLRDGSDATSVRGTQDAFTEAARAWPRRGVPDRPAPG